MLQSFEKYEEDILQKMTHQKNFASIDKFFCKKKSAQTFFCIIFNFIIVKKNILWQISEDAFSMDNNQLGRLFNAILSYIPV